MPNLEFSSSLRSTISQYNNPVYSALFPAPLPEDKYNFTLRTKPSRLASVLNSITNIPFGIINFIITTKADRVDQQKLERLSHEYFEKIDQTITSLHERNTPDLTSISKNIKDFQKGFSDSKTSPAILKALSISHDRKYTEFMNKLLVIFSNLSEEERTSLRGHKAALIQHIKNMQMQKIRNAYEEYGVGALLIEASMLTYFTLIAGVWSLPLSLPALLILDYNLFNSAGFSQITQYLKSAYEISQLWRMLTTGACLGMIKGTEDIEMSICVSVIFELPSVLLFGPIAGTLVASTIFLGSAATEKFIFEKIDPFITNIEKSAQRICAESPIHYFSRILFANDLETQLEDYVNGYCAKTLITKYATTPDNGAALAGEPGMA